jgi:hypothetical protein
MKGLRLGERLPKMLKLSVISFKQANLSFMSRLLPKLVPLLVWAVFVGLLAIADPFFMFHLFGLVLAHTWFQYLNYMLYIFPLFPPCPCPELFIVSTCAMFYWCVTGFVPMCLLFCKPLV